MSAGYLRELTLYALHDEETLIKTRKVVHCSVKPCGEAETSEKFIPREYVFFPHCRFLVYWAVLMLVTLMYQTLTVPFFFSFDEIETNISIGIDVFCSLAFICDVLVGMNSCYFHKGELVFSRKAIIKRYVKRWLWLDILTTVPYYSILDSWTEPSYEKLDLSRLMRCVRLARVLKLNKSITTIRCHLPTAKAHFMFTILLLTLIVVHIAHWVSCGFYYIAFWSPVHQSWIFKKNGLSESELENYIMAFDWTISTLTTTGYGDIAPCSTPEKIYGIAIMLLSVAVFSYFVGKISADVLAVDRDEARHKALRVEIQNFFEGRSIPKGLMYRALRHFEYGWASREESRRLDNRLLSHFSEPLRNEISEHIYGRVLELVPMFRNFDATVIRKISRSMEGHVYAPDDQVIKENDISSDIYFVEKGSVDVYHHQTEHTFMILRPGQYFGELAFFTGCLRTASVRCIEFCDLLKLRRDALLDVLPQSHSAIRAYQSIQSKFESFNYGDLGITCFLCDSTHHIARDCDICKVRTNQEYFRDRWLRKRVSTVLLDTQEETFNFKRRQRKVRLNRRYSLLNVKADKGWNQLKGAGRKLARHLSQSSCEQSSLSAGVEWRDSVEVMCSRSEFDPPESIETESVSSEDSETGKSGPVPLFTNRSSLIPPQSTKQVGVESDAESSSYI